MEKSEDKSGEGKSEEDKSDEETSQNLNWRKRKEDVNNNAREKKIVKRASKNRKVIKEFYISCEYIVNYETPEASAEITRMKNEEYNGYDFFLPEADYKACMYEEKDYYVAFFDKERIKLIFPILVNEEEASLYHEEDIYVLRDLILEYYERK